MSLNKCSSSVSLLPKPDSLLLRLETVFKISFCWPDPGKQLPSMLLPDALPRHWMRKGPETHPGVQGSPEFKRRESGDTSDYRQTGLRGSQGPGAGKTRQALTENQAVCVLLVDYFPSPLVFLFFFFKANSPLKIVTCFILLRKKKRPTIHAQARTINNEGGRKVGMEVNLKSF